MTPAEQGDGGAADRSRGRAGFGSAAREPRPDETAGETLLIEPRRVVLVDSRRQDLCFPCSCRCLEALELCEDGGDSIWPLHPCPRRCTLPLEQETQEIARFHRLDLRPQALHGVAMDARQQPALAPFPLCRRLGGEPAMNRRSFRLQRNECRCHSSWRHANRRRQRCCRYRAQALQTPPRNFDESIVRAPG